MTDPQKFTNAALPVAVPLTPLLDALERMGVPVAGIEVLHVEADRLVCLYDTPFGTRKFEAGLVRA